MKLTSVELTPKGGTGIATLSFRDPGADNAFNVMGITGLDTDEIIPRYYQGSGTSAKFYALSLERRDAVLRIQLNPRFELGETFSSLRDSLYKLISSSRSGTVNLHLKNNATVVAAVSGFVSKIEAPNFERNQEVFITIKCDDPMLRALTAVEINVTGLDPVFTTISDPLSTAPHGFQFQIAVLNSRPYFSISDPNDPTWGFVVQPATGILADDVIYLSSEYNNKQLYMIRGVEIIQLADSIVSGSVWPLIFPGNNTFFVEDSISFQWLNISHYPTYWGV